MGIRLGLDNLDLLLNFTTKIFFKYTFFKNNPGFIHFWFTEYFPDSLELGQFYLQESLFVFIHQFKI